MTCYLCNQPIDAQATVNWHHYETPRCEGGEKVAPTHQRCHVEYHSSNGQFKAWGKQGGQKAALTMRWAFNLLNVRTHPAYDSHRQFYLMNYASAGWGEGLIM
jgi:hypothetical protein